MCCEAERMRGLAHGCCATRPGVTFSKLCPRAVADGRLMPYRAGRGTGGDTGVNWNSDYSKWTYPSLFPEASMSGWFCSKAESFLPQQGDVYVQLGCTSGEDARAQGSRGQMWVGSQKRERESCGK